MTGIQSDVDEVSVEYLNTYLQESGQALFCFKIILAIREPIVPFFLSVMVTMIEGVPQDGLRASITIE